MAKVIALTHEKLTELLAYDPATGIFTWKVSRSNRVKPGSRAGVFHPASGGRYMAIGEERFRAHRLAWFYVHKRWPNTEVLPIDGNYDNCAIDNLKEVSRVEVAHTRAKNVDNQSGFLGVSKAKFGRWQASITWNYRQMSLGSNFDTAEEASQTYEDAASALKSASTQEGVAVIIEGVRKLRRQRAAWKYVQRDHPGHVWASFEAFVESVTELPTLKYAMVPSDVGLPMGPTNFRWVLPLDTKHSTRDGAVAYNRVKRLASKDHQRLKHLKKAYNADVAYERQKLVEQNGCCAICKKPETMTGNSAEERALSLDHNHGTGKLRGLLCNGCNNGIGYLCEDAEILRSAIAYLKHYSDAEDNVTPFKPSIVGGVLGEGT